MDVVRSARIDQLVIDRIPFVHATVVRASLPTSVRAGDDAIVLSDGSIEGFVGGQCAEGSVRSAALGALKDGESLLLRILPEGQEEFPQSTGARVVVNPCLSGGTLEIFLQPLLPPPLMWVVGQSPIAIALAELARPLGWHIIGLGEQAGASGATAVVLATHGGDEIGPIREALDAGVGYIGLVASRKRGAALLAEMDLTESERSRIRPRAGLDIGARTAPEIALSILAEIVASMRIDRLSAPAVRDEHPESESAGVAIDPVCGMTVQIVPGTPHLVVSGEDLWFCGPGCRDRHAAAMLG